MLCVYGVVHVFMHTYVYVCVWMAWGRGNIFNVLFAIMLASTDIFIEIVYRQLLCIVFPLTTVFGRSLEKDVISDTSGHFKNFMTAILTVSEYVQLNYWHILGFCWFDIN